MGVFGAHMLTDSVDIEPVDSLADDGSVNYGPKTTGVAARVERNIEMSVGDTGTTSDTVTAVWLEQEVSQSDRIHLPDGEVMEVQATETIPGVYDDEIYKAMG